MKDKVNNLIVVVVNGVSFYYYLGNLVGVSYLDRFVICDCAGYFLSDELFSDIGIGYNFVSVAEFREVLGSICYMVGLEDSPSVKFHDVGSCPVPAVGSKYEAMLDLVENFGINCGDYPKEFDINNDMVGDVISYAIFNVINDETIDLDVSSLELGDLDVDKFYYEYCFGFSFGGIWVGLVDSPTKHRVMNLNDLHCLLVALIKQIIAEKS